LFFFSSRRRHTRCYRDWSSDVCSSDLERRYRAWFLKKHADRPLLASYRDLAKRFPQGLADFAPLPEEISGAVNAVAVREPEVETREASRGYSEVSAQRAGGRVCRLSPT